MSMFNLTYVSSMSLELRGPGESRQKPAEDKQVFTNEKDHDTLKEMKSRACLSTSLGTCHLLKRLQTQPAQKLLVTEKNQRLGL